MTPRKKTPAKKKPATKRPSKKRVAAALEGFSFVGIEKEPEYVQIARARLNLPPA